jgi:hypothetical protein
MILQRALGHVLIDQDPLVRVCAVAEQLDEVGVVKEAEHEHLDEELAVALEPVPVQLLHGDHLFGVPEDSLVHAPESALPEQVSLAEPVGRSAQLPERQRPAGHVLVAASQDPFGGAHVLANVCIERELLGRARLLIFLRIREHCTL